MDPFLTIDADAVREQIDALGEVDDLTEEEVQRLHALPDAELVDAIRSAAADDFWYAYNQLIADAVRSLYPR